MNNSLLFYSFLVMSPLVFIKNLPSKLNKHLPLFLFVVPIFRRCWSTRNFNAQTNDF